MRILVVQKDGRWEAAIERQLSDLGYAIDRVKTVSLALLAVHAEHFDLIVLDADLPNNDGIKFIQEMRCHKLPAPILVVASCNGVDARVSFLNSGADDHMTKPIVVAELYARVHSLIRRQFGLVKPQLKIGRLQLDLVCKQATLDSGVLDMSPREWALLEYFAIHFGSVLSKDRLMQAIHSWQDSVAPNTIEKQICRLRKKISMTGITISTMRGHGYVLNEDLCA